MLKRMGARLHPRSGAGSIKHDGSDAECLYEIKDAERIFTMKFSELELLHRRAARQGKRGVLLVQFPKGYVAEVHVRRESV